MSFSAVILAGGQSSRMGRDKAWLEIGGQPLLARQIHLARTVGASEVFISGRINEDYSQLGCPVLADNFPASGPLAGIESALRRCGDPLLLVLAVDMPMMNAELLRKIIAGSSGSIGVVPRVAGRVEPLAAVYPQVAARLATELLAGAPAGTDFGAPGVGAFAARCRAEGWVKFFELPEEAATRFVSWNEPKDVAKL